MTLLQLIQDAALELKLSAPDTVIGNTDANIKLLLALAHRELKEARRKMRWPQLVKEHTFSLVTSQANYAFPDDFDRQVFETHWDRTNDWALIGPITPVEWQHIKSGAITTFPRKRFRVKGFATNQFFIDPTPTSSENGNTLVFEYVSKTCVRPRIWEAGQTYNANTYTFYNGNIYSTTAGGNTGATPPTHTSGSASDDNVTWVYYGDAYEKFLADTDVPLIDDQVVLLGTKYRWLEVNGFDYRQTKLDYEETIRSRKVAIEGAPVLSLGGDTWSQRFLGSSNIPDTGYGS